MNNYVAYIDKIVPKVITQVDRDPHSMTYGSCDRNYWHLKIRDFSSAILQQTGLALILLYQLEFEGNEFFLHEDVKDWGIATLYYWEQIQLKDGSFNEYYPNEHGFPPTAFSLYSSCEIYKRLHINDDRLIKAFNKTGDYLINHIETKAFNQEIASITALYSLYSITSSTIVFDGLNRKLERILSLQSEEGWFSEYEGADIGYLSVSLDMLAEYYWMSKDKRVIEPLSRIVSFIKYFVHPDGTIGGEYGSRNTTYFLPNGLEVLVQLGNQDALFIKENIYKDSIKPGFFLDGVDDRYCSHYLLHSFLRALEKERYNKTNISYKSLEFKSDKYFSEAGLYIRKTNNNYCVIGIKKGGLIKCYLNDVEFYNDCGYRINYGKGKVAATNWQDNTYSVNISGNKISLSGLFNVISLKTPTPFLHFVLRMISKIFGNKIISALKSMIILVNKHNDVKFNRLIEIDRNKLIITDIINSPRPINLETANNSSLRHVASGKFFSKSDLCQRHKAIYEQINYIQIEKTINLSDGSLYVKELKTL